MIWPTQYQEHEGSSGVTERGSLPLDQREPGRQLALQSLDDLGLLLDHRKPSSRFRILRCRLLNQRKSSSGHWLNSRATVSSRAAGLHAAQLAGLLGHGASRGRLEVIANSEPLPDHDRQDTSRTGEGRAGSDAGLWIARRSWGHQRAIRGCYGHEEAPGGLVAPGAHSEKRPGALAGAPWWRGGRGQRGRRR